MFIPPDIPPEHIVPELRATERYAAIRELLRHLVHVGAVPPQAEGSLFDAIRLREETLSTGVGFGVAIPHASSEAVTERVVALGRSSIGIDFASTDGQPARVVVLMVFPHSMHRAVA